MRRKLLILGLLLILTTMAFAPLEQEATPWRSVFVSVIGVFLTLLGAPLTQYFKKLLQVQDRWAMVLTAVVATIVALAETFLSGILTLSSFNIDNFPLAFTTVFTVATIYYELFKGTDTVLGKRLLLPETEPDHDLPI